MKKAVFFQIAAVACITAGSVFLARAATVTVDVKKQYQRIAGFGTCSAWCGTLSSSMGEQLWSTTKGAGLSVHRIMIDRNGPGSDEKANAKQAAGYGVTVWGTPWYTKGGVAVSGKDYDTLYEKDYQAWADVLASSANALKSAGSPLYAVSSGNESDLGWTKYDAPTLAKWVGKYLGPTMASKAPDTKVMGVETCNWYGFSNYYKVFKADADAWKYSAILATHEYGGSPAAYPDIQPAGKEFWQTEIYDTDTKEDPGMGSALRIAKLIHEALAIANMNAWHYWWVKESGANNGALWDIGTNKFSKRLWIMGNWSRYARPGFVRVDATAAPASGVTVTAFRDSLLSRVVIVAINNNSASTSLDFSMAGTSPQKLTPCITDPTRDLVEQAAQTLSSSTFTYALPAQSVTSLVVDMTGTPVSPSRRATAGPSLSLQTHVARSTLWARFTPPESGPVSLNLYDLKGDLLRTSSKIASSGSVCTAGFDLSGISADCCVLRVDHNGKTVAAARVPLVKE